MPKQPPTSIAKEARQKSCATPSKSSVPSTTPSSDALFKPADNSITMFKKSKLTKFYVVYFPLAKDDDDDVEEKDEFKDENNDLVEEDGYVGEEELDERQKEQPRWRQRLVKLDLDGNIALLDLCEAIAKMGFLGPDKNQLQVHNIKIWRPLPHAMPAKKGLPFTDAEMDELYLKPIKEIALRYAEQDITPLTVNSTYAIVFVTYCEDISLAQSTVKQPTSTFYSTSFRDYLNHYRLPGNAPSAASQLQAFRDMQGSCFAVLDGRGAPAKPAPIGMRAWFYHPVFETFLRNQSNPSLQPSQARLKAAAALMQRAPTVYRKEKDLLAEIEPLFSLLLGKKMKGCTNTDDLRPDGVVWFEMPLDSENVMNFLLVIQENKLISHNATTQASHSYIHTLLNPECQMLLNYTCCPTILIGLTGAMLEISGAVLTNMCIVERLSVQYIGLSHAQNECDVVNVARTFEALDLALTELSGWYANVCKSIPLKDNSNGRNIPRPRQRYFPYPKRYTGANTGDVEFTYICPLQTSPQCVTFLATTTKDSKKVVVKFVERYCAEVHHLLADEQRAPRLLYCGPVYPELQSDLSSSVNFNTMKMVVMEYFDGQPMHLVKAKLTKQERQSVAAKVEEAIACVHRHGYVFGDLREPNVLCNRVGEVRLVDFDWAGKQGEVKYPFFMTPGIWAIPEQMQAADPILQSHDLAMFEMNFTVN